MAYQQHQHQQPLPPQSSTGVPMSAPSNAVASTANSVSGAVTAGWFDWAYKGVDHSYPGNGGLECRDFLSLTQRCWESGIASLVAAAMLFYAVPRLRLPRHPACGYYPSSPGGVGGDTLGKRLLLLLMCLTFGIELGFKLATRQMIWIGNPCHVTTMLQVGYTHVL